MFVQIHFPQMVFNDQDEDVGQHLHKFFATENQLALISLLNDLRSLHDSFPLRRALPRQRLVKYLSVHSLIISFLIFPFLSFFFEIFAIGGSNNSIFAIQ